MGAARRWSIAAVRGHAAADGPGWTCRPVARGRCFVARGDADRDRVADAGRREPAARGGIRRHGFQHAGKASSSRRPPASARDLGTQFEVRFIPGELRLSVREGSVSLQRASGGDLGASAGERLTINAAGEVSRRNIARDDPDWAWAETLVAMPDFDDQPSPPCWRGWRAGRIGRCGMRMRSRRAGRDGHPAWPDRSTGAARCIAGAVGDDQLHVRNTAGRYNRGALQVGARAQVVKPRTEPMAAVARQPVVAPAAGPDRVTAPRRVGGSPGKDDGRVRRPRTRAGHRATRR